MALVEPAKNEDIQTVLYAAFTDEMALFDAQVIGVRRHAAPCADVTHLVSFRLHDPPTTLDRWHLQIERMRVEL